MTKSGFAWMVEIGHDPVRVGPFNSEQEASNWKLDCDQILVSLGHFRSTQVRFALGGVFYDADLRFGVGTSPTDVATDIGCLEFCHQEARTRGFKILDAERDGLIDEFMGLVVSLFRDHRTVR